MSTFTKRRWKIRLDEMTIDCNEFKAQNDQVQEEWPFDREKFNINNIVEKCTDGQDIDDGDMIGLMTKMGQE